MIPPAVLATVVLLVSLLVSGCATLRDPLRFEVLDQWVPLRTDDARVVSLAGELAATAAERTSLVGAARVSLRSPNLRVSRPQRVAAMRPASLRVEVLGLFSQVAAILTTDGVRYQLYDLASSRVEEGEAGRSLLWELARVDLEPKEAVGLLLGCPLDPDASLEEARTREDGTIGIAFRHPGDGSRRVFEFDPAARLARVRHRAADGFLLWEAAYADYRDTGDHAFAHEIDIDFPEQEAQAAFHFQTAELNRDLPASAFALQPAPAP